MQINWNKKLRVALLAGDPTAFEWMVRTHGGFALGVCRRVLQDEQESRECLQEIFEALRSLEHLDHLPSLRTWLHRIAVDVALGRIRTRSGSRESIHDLLPRFDEENCRIAPDRAETLEIRELLGRGSTRQRVRDAVLSLPEPYRSVLWMCDLEGYSAEEAAAALDLRVDAASLGLHRARSALKKLLEPVLHETERADSARATDSMRSDERGIGDDLDE